jgi:hypothetical protein
MQNSRNQDICQEKTDAEHQSKIASRPYVRPEDSELFNVANPSPGTLQSLLLQLFHLFIRIVIVRFRVGFVDGFGFGEDMR